MLAKFIEKARASLRTKEDFRLVTKGLPNDNSVLCGCSSKRVWCINGGSCGKHDNLIVKEREEAAKIGSRLCRTAGIRMRFHYTTGVPSTTVTKLLRSRVQGV